MVTLDTDHRIGRSLQWRRIDPQLAVLLVVAVAARVATLVSLAPLPWLRSPNADSEIYDAMARAFAAGDWLLGSGPLRMSPAYPVLLGTIYRLLGDGIWPIRIVQGLFGVGLVALTWDTARLLAGRPAALVAGAITALFGPELFYEAQLLGDAPSAALAALALWMIVRAVLRKEARPLRWLALGMVTGSVALFRPNALLLIGPLVLAAVATEAPHRLRRICVLACVCGFVVGLSPVPIRNLIVTGRPTLTATNGGIDLYIGNGPSATGALHVPSELQGANGPGQIFESSEFAAERALGHPLDPVAADRYWMQRTIAFVAADPVPWLRLMLWKLRLFWNGASISDVEHYEFTRILDRVLALPFVQWWPLMALAIPGTILALRTRQPIAIVAAVNLVWCAGVTIIFVVDRYRLPALSGMAIVSGFALVQAEHIWRHGSLRATAFLVALFAASILASWPVGVINDFGRQWFRLGVTYERAGDNDRARDAYRRALTLEPDNIDARRALQRLPLRDSLELR